MAKYKAKKYTKNSKRANQVVKVAKTLMLKQVEDKQMLYNMAKALDHNTIYTVSPTQQIVQGTTSATRVGDTILLGSYTFTGFVQVNAGVLNGKFRIVVGFSRSTTANVTLASTGLSISDVFYNSGGYNSELIVNPTLFTTLSDDVVDINSYASSSDLHSFTIHNKLGHRKFHFGGPGSAFGVSRSLYFVIIPCNSLNVAGAFGAIQGTAMLKFKDP